MIDALIKRERQRDRCYGFDKSIKYRNYSFQHEKVSLIKQSTSFNLFLARERMREQLMHELWSLQLHEKGERNNLPEFNTQRIEILFLH